MNILVISKFQSSSEFLAIFLRMLGHHATSPENGAAISMLKAKRFDILLLGCELSPIESLKLANLFRKRNPGGGVIALVAKKGLHPCFKPDAVVEVSNGAPALLSTIQTTYQRARAAAAAGD